MKKISIVIPTYNEENNICPLYEAIINEMNRIPNYDYEILFIDNKSKDNTRDKIKILCIKDAKVKAIFNAKNFGQFNSPFYGLTQSSGDCTILLCADFQDPVEIIPKFIHEWENGYKIVVGIKTSSDENRFIYTLRSIYYKLIKSLSEVEQIEHFTGFGLYDRDFIDILKNLNDPNPYLRGIVSELGYERKEIPYKQAKRKHGKSSNSWYKLYDAGMLGITSYTKITMRVATILGFICSGLLIVLALVYLLLKIFFWSKFPMGIVPIILSIFFIGAVQLFFIGILGEYILNINSRITNRPLVVEEERINFNKN